MAEARGHLATERANPASEGLEQLSALAAVDVMIEEDRSIHTAVHAARAQIAAAVELVAQRLASSGRLIYVGAGTSGRLATLDAVECPPTFGTPPELVQAALAGGVDALLASVEGAEDSVAEGRKAMELRAVEARDVVFGITAGGTTAYVHAALKEASARGAATVFFACVPSDVVPDDADVSIRVLTGPEVLAGSTRLKAGTATKMVLNMITTLSMARLGKIHGNLMVDVNTKGNRKLVDRGERLVESIGRVSRERASDLLERADGSVKAAVVMAIRDCSPDQARAHLDRCDGFLRRALEGDT
ncbi:MAG: N-acetylmuramic acid 6-phosphate etherase [Chlamydiales bacterium]|jgi:N-acetylmuramic acid 6-phosphate etherase